MAVTEKGVVTRIEHRRAWVKTSRTSACEGCKSRGACHVAENGSEMEVEVINEAGAAIGDRIVLSIESSSLLKISFMLYIFPVLMMLAGAVVGQQISGFLRWNPSGTSALLGLLSFLLAFCIIRIKGNRMARRDKYRPRIIKILP